jgi:hypothetical protein
LENVCRDFRTCSGLPEKEALELLTVVLSNMLEELKADLEAMASAPAP